MHALLHRRRPSLTHRRRLWRMQQEKRLKISRDSKSKVNRKRTRMIADRIAAATALLLLQRRIARVKAAHLSRNADRERPPQTAPTQRSDLRRTSAAAIPTSATTTHRAAIEIAAAMPQVPAMRIMRAVGIIAAAPTIAASLATRTIAAATTNARSSKLPKWRSPIRRTSRLARALPSRILRAR